MDLPAHVTMGSNGVGTVTFGSDANINVHFYAKAVLDPVASQAAGRAVHKQVDYVRLQHPGERDVVDAPVSDKPEMPLRFAAQWTAYQQRKEHVPEGTPIEMLFPQNPEIAANLHTMAIHTVEQMANCGAIALQQIGMGAQNWQTAAKAFLSAANKGVEFHRMQKELKDRDNKIEVLQNNLTLLTAQVERLMAEKSGHAQQTALSVHATAPMAAQAAPVYYADQATHAYSAEPSAASHQFDLGATNAAPPQAEQSGVSRRRRNIGARK
jgi:hypothetical protein